MANSLGDRIRLIRKTNRLKPILVGSLYGVNENVLKTQETIALVADLKQKVTFSPQVSWFLHNGLRFKRCMVNVQILMQQEEKRN